MLTVLNEINEFPASWSEHVIGRARVKYRNKFNGRILSFKRGTKEAGNCVREWEDHS